MKKKDAQYFIDKLGVFETYGGIDIYTDLSIKDRFDLIAFIKRQEKRVKKLASE